MMPSECCNSDPWKTLANFLREMKWVNEDYPEANRALIEGLRSGFIGYETDNIIQRITRKLSQKPQASFEGQGQCVPPPPKSLNELEELLGGSPPVQFPIPSNTPPVRGPSSLLIRPTTIGEERRKWLDTRKPTNFEEFQHRMSKSEMYFCNDDGDNVHGSLSASSASCPNFEASSLIPVNGHECHEHESNEEHEPSNTQLYDDESCTCIFKSAEGRMNPNKFRLSPRIEKLDRLIPKTSKEFIDTFRIVNTITPQSSEEELQKKLGSGNPDRQSREENGSCCNSTVMDDGTREENTRRDHALNAPPPLKTVRGSYKEACLFGHHASATGTGTANLLSTGRPREAASPRCRADNPQFLEFNDSSGSKSRPSVSFPSLLNLRPEGGHFVNHASPKNSPPLYSSILQRTPAPSSNYERKDKDNESSCASPTDSIGAHDCGFCRTNNEPEHVYRSHPLRINDVVVCPALRKYVCCFCGATGDKAHTIKYCPKNPIGFFAKKGRHCPMTSPPSLPEKEETLRRTSGKTEKKRNKSFTLESKSESESVLGTDDTLEPIKRLSENWITAKTKGRRKKSGKRK